MAETVITVENLSKSYRLGQIGGGTLKEDVARFWAKIRSKPDPSLRIGEENRGRANRELFWALRDIDFQVKQGEVLGIVGRNGAGKSTLLKILSQVTSPTSGCVKVKGRIASLLEVGTGFHPELTGRENIFLNGAILGMTKREIRRKFDEIVAFSGIDEFVDTPVKRYSSGMYVRLAFGVAAHLEPEILIVDEVLAVGDTEFQKKCIGKMGEVSKSGRTVLFVSHNLVAVTSLCSRAILLESGEKRMDGDPETVVSAHIQAGAPMQGEMIWDANARNANNGRLRLIRARVLSGGELTADVVIDRPTTIEYEFAVLVDGLNVCTSIHLRDKLGNCVLASGNAPEVLKVGVYCHSCVLPANFLNDIPYFVRVILLTDTTHFEIDVPDAISFVAHETQGREGYLGSIIGCVRPRLEWRHREVTDDCEALQYDDGAVGIR